MKTAIAIFVKTLGLSPVKTRLALDIGKKNAEIFYQLSVKAVEEVIFEVKNISVNSITPYWALAEEEALNNAIWSSFDTIWTGEGGLGNRISNVFDQLFKQYENVIIIGSDSPQISSKYILKAVDNLVNGIDDVVIGPCNDGGFVLFGSKVNIAKSVWTDVEYSKNSTLGQLTEKLDKEKATYSYIPKISDVDNYNDLKTIYNVLKLNFMDNLKAQNELALWIDSIIHFDSV